MGAIAKKNFLCSISGVAALPERETAGEGRSAIAVFGLTTVFERTPFNDLTLFVFISHFFRVNTVINKSSL